ncbi:unnamed protein product [Cyclocybe aegerita]|uniref:Uncharacterized protein n=1 Tax=Cyclocybe aegerita TaxID=1973307 RepID=A0A8S0XRK3_CYCAE|nr:unnamed protein product [Cyclocybe aegerita]
MARLTRLGHGPRMRMRYALNAPIAALKAVAKKQLSQWVLSHAGSGRSTLVEDGQEIQKMPISERTEGYAPALIKGRVASDDVKPFLAPDTERQLLSPELA